MCLGERKGKKEGGVKTAIQKAKDNTPHDHAR